MDFAPLDLVLAWTKRIVLSDNVLMTLIAVPVLLLFEVWRPAIKGTPKRWRHYRFGFSFFAVNAVVLALIAPASNAAVALAVQSIGFGLIDLRALGFGGLGGSLFALFVSTLILDFFLYWFHRVLHGNEALWQTHLLHHSDEEMNMMTAQRGHFLEGLVAQLFATIPMAVLFKLPAIQIGVLAVLPYIYLFFAHSNLKVGFGPFWWLIISPNYHRIHHSSELQHRDKNFTNWFPIWDILFGTVWRPRPGECPATGVTGVQVDTLKQAYLQPFVGWRALLKRRTPAAFRIRSPM